MEFVSVNREDMQELAPYFAAQKYHIGDFSLAFQFMWFDALKPAYAIVENCLVIREFYAGKCYYHYPMSLSGDIEEEMRAVKAIENYCREEYIRLHFTNVPESRVQAMIARYGEAHVTNNRRWRDYLYAAEDFRSYPGKKYAGQRNHVRKFEKLYPDWTFSELSPSDMGGVYAFLKEYEEVQRAKGNYIAEEEMDEVYALLPYLGQLGLFAGVLKVESRMVGFSVGEKCGDMIVVHIEKALRGYEGVYPFLAQQFARRFCGKGVDFLNRMDDAGDLGLRKSKLQYNPCELVAKYNVTPHRAIELAGRLPKIETERLILMPVREEDAADYARLASDKVRNQYWGEVWGMVPSKRVRSDKYYLKLAKDSFAHRWEMPLGIYAQDQLVGEAVLHTFGYTAEAEVGVRLLPEFEGLGYAKEAVRAYTDYAFSKLNVERMEAKCYRENARSRVMLQNAGMREVGADETYFYFVRTPVM